MRNYGRFNMFRYLLKMRTFKVFNFESTHYFFYLLNFFNGKPYFAVIFVGIITRRQIKFDIEIIR